VTALNGFLKPGFRIFSDFQRQSLAGQSDGFEDRGGQIQWFRDGETGRSGRTTVATQVLGVG
jgi:hypothetical protein